MFVKNLDGPPLPAQEVYVTREEGSGDSLDTERAVMLLQNQQRGRVFYEGNLIGLRHLGLSLRFKVTNVTPYFVPRRDGNLVNPLDQLVDSMQVR